MYELLRVKQTKTKKRKRREEKEEEKTNIFVFFSSFCEKLCCSLDLDLIITENLIFKILNFRFYFFEKLCAGMYVTKLVGLMFGLIFFLDLFAAIGLSGGFAIFIYFILFIGIFVILLIISRQPQNR